MILLYGLADVSVKNQKVNILRFAGLTFSVTTLTTFVKSKESIEDLGTNKPDCVLIKLYLLK